MAWSSTMEKSVRVRFLVDSGAMYTVLTRSV
jgi:hypothetical protein